MFCNLGTDTNVKLHPYSKSQTRSSWRVAETFANPMTIPMTIFISSMLRKVATKLKPPNDILMLTGTAMVRAKA